MEIKINQQKITAIVCAYNEENTINGVMDTLINTPLISEVIAVDDGSKDKTSEILSGYQHLEHVHIVLLPKNRGKGYAMATAALQASGEILLFVDADLKNLTTHHISLLLIPFLNRETEMVIGFPIRSETISVAEWLDPYRPLSGQRVVYKEDFLALINPIRYSGYGVETILNLHYREQGKRVKSIFLPNLIHPIKVEKTGLKQAVGEYLLEGKQILITKIKNPHLVWGAIFSAANRK
ncbi:MAG: glycosyl transferase family 2 [Anaerolineaceae bacterium]|nr:glycosyl transferase family 2 [Anaerolineaceae bacterium]